MTWMRVPGAFALVALALAPARAVAQEPPRLSIAAGAGVAVPLHSDFDFTASEWQVSVRGAAGRHFALEGFYSDWRHDETTVRLDTPITGPTSFLGRVGRMEETTTRDLAVAGFNGLATGSSGRVTFAAGGGIGLLMFRRTFRQISTGCEPSVAELCRTFENEFTSSAMTGQGVVDVDVALTRRVRAFGRYQLIIPFEDPGSGQGSIAGGVRVVLW